MDIKKIIAGFIAFLALLFGLVLGFGTNAVIVWVVCKIMGWTFAWKWVVLFTLIFVILKSLLRD